MILTKVKANMMYETRMKLRNALVFGSTELLPLEMVEKAAEKGHPKGCFFQRELSHPPAKQRQSTFQGLRFKSSFTKHSEPYSPPGHPWLR